ncbi:hypothetical protein CYY_003500 [Polysphondylium violaceum]|uniref:IPT/TIG domain-containing protein n=1 Tax=Polysphondylium violaceum TaxID=133409 RepID=A0A8J4V061_9MYCE|nr:hypothetical protein CYY_003500 [Polysphondylium violaceum]
MFKNKQLYFIFTLIGLISILSLLPVTKADLTNSQKANLVALASDLGFDWLGLSNSLPKCGSYSRRSLITCDSTKKYVTGLVLDSSNPTAAPGDRFAPFIYLKQLVIYNSEIDLSKVPSILSHPNLTDFQFYSEFGSRIKLTSSWSSSSLIKSIHTENTYGTIPDFSTSMNYFFISQAPTGSFSPKIQTSLFNPNLIEYSLFVSSTPQSPSSLTQAFLDSATSLTKLELQLPGYSIDFSLFFNLPTVQTLAIIDAVPITKTFPLFSQVSWGSLTSLTLVNLQLTGTLEPNYFFITSLQTLKLNNNPSLSIALSNDIGFLSFIKNLYLEDTNMAGSTVPRNILSNGIKNLYLRNTHLSGALPSVFLCVSESSLIDDGTEPTYLFDNNTFTNYFGPGSPRSCSPKITSIDPSPLRANMSSVVIKGEDLGDSFQIILRNSVDDVATMGCLTTDSTDELFCGNPFLQGTGTLFYRIITDTFPNTTVTFTYQRPSITSVTPAPTLGGFITITGYDLMGKVNAKKSSISIYGKDCTNLKIIRQYEQVSCYYPEGITSNVPISLTVKDLSNDIENSPNFFYKSPLVTSSTAAIPNQNSALTIYGTDFWNQIDMANVSVDIDGNTIPCSITFINHTEIVCTLAPTPFSSGSKNLKVSVNGQESPENKLFEFIDPAFCPNGCNGERCDVGIGFCSCKSVFGPSCSEGTKSVNFDSNSWSPSSPRLKIVSSLNDTMYMTALLKSIVENGAETTIPSWTSIYDNATDSTQYGWGLGYKSINVTIRHNTLVGYDLIGGSTLYYPSNSFVYKVEYSSSIPVYDLQFKFELESNQECSTPPISVAYPTGSNGVGGRWMTIVKDKVKFFSRFPVISNVNGIVSSIQTNRFNANENSTSFFTKVSNSNGLINTVAFQFDFSVMQASNNEVRVVRPVSECIVVPPTLAPTDTPTNPPTTIEIINQEPRSNKPALIGGIVGGVVGAAIVAVGLVFIIRQHSKLNKTKSLLDKKLSELNNNL